MTPIKPTPGEETLKAWVHWVLLNPLDDDQRMHAEATRALFERIAELDGQLSARVDLLYCGNCAAVEAREQRLIEAFEGLIKELRDAAGPEGRTPLCQKTCNRVAEWAQAALVEAKGEKG